MIIVCGLPGSGKTTYARLLEEKQRAIRFSADDWMSALAIDLYNESKRDAIEALQWKLAQELLASELVVIIEWQVRARHASPRSPLPRSRRGIALPGRTH